LAFRFAARTLLELGKELISSDEVAIYELIKNAVDAGSPRVEIVASLVLPSTAYFAAMENLLNGEKPRTVLDLVRERLFPGVSRERIAAFLDQLEGVVDRPHRFQGVLMAAYRKYNWIEIRDAGHGMSLKELDDVYLTVGTRSRRSANISGAHFLGDKGVGRLSAMRLGNRLTVTTTRASETHWNLLSINWALFTHELETDISEIPIVPRRGSVKQDPAQQGTRIRISHLTADWNLPRFTDLFQGQIARMVDPFEPGRGNRLLMVRHNDDRVVIPSIPPKLLAGAHASCRASLRFEEGEPILEGIIDYRLRQKQRPIAQRGVEVYSVTQKTVKRRGKKGHAAISVEPIRSKALQDLGPFDVEVYWYNRLVVTPIAGLTESIQGTRDEVARWSGGPMLYRHGFRILPYGNPGDDWLGLDEAAFGERGFKLNRQQLVGRVRVSSPHTALSEQTNREGLVRSEPSDALRIIMIWLLHVEMRGLINEADTAEKLSALEAERATFEFRDTQRLVEESLGTLRRQIDPDHRRYVDQLSQSVALLANQCETLVRKTLDHVDEVVEEREKFVYLAGIGLMTDFIFHELDRAVTHTLQALGDIRGAGRVPALQSLEEQLVTLQKRISAFDELTGEQRQTKSIFNLDELVRLTIANHTYQFERHGIAVHFQPTKPGLKITAVRGMVVQIFENLIANSIYWLKQQKRYEKPGFQPEIFIQIDPESQAISIEDNGPGIDPKRKEVIFQPFATSKPPGQGRGLGLYISRELANYHDWKLVLDPQAGRKRPGRLSRFILEMSHKHG